MEIKLGVILGIIIVSSLLLSAVSGFWAVVGRFEKVYEHPELKECAASNLHQAASVGVRISQQEDTCQALPRSWAIDEIIESGYAYAKKVFVQESFHPLHEVVAEFNWKIPGVLKTGARLDLFVLHSNPLFFAGHVVLNAYPGSYYDQKADNLSRFASSFNSGGTFDCVEQQELYNGAVNDTGQLKKENWSERFVKSHPDSKQMVKISFLAQADSVRVLANDTELLTYPLKKHLDIMKYVNVLWYTEEYPVFIDRFQFTEK